MSDAFCSKIQLDPSDSVDPMSRWKYECLTLIIITANDHIPIEQLLESINRIYNGKVGLFKYKLMLVFNVRN